MRNLPEIPLNLTPEEAEQKDGDVPAKPIYQTHRGKLPEGHEDKRPYVDPPQGLARYREVDD